MLERFTGLCKLIKMSKGYINYLGLIFDCPVGKELESCSYRLVRKIKPRERLVHYETLTLEEKDEMIEKHQRCLSSREKKTLFHESQ